MTTDKARMTYPKIGLLIDGKWIHDRPPLCEVENPSDESILGTVPKACARDPQDVLAAAAKGFEIWRRVPASLLIPDLAS